MKQLVKEFQNESASKLPQRGKQLNVDYKMGCFLVDFFDTPIVHCQAADAPGTEMEAVRVRNLGHTSKYGHDQFDENHPGS